MLPVNDGTYHQLSRKELQNLCKKYGLPANRSNLEMENSLSPHLQVGSGKSSNLKETSCVRIPGQSSKEGSKTKASPILKSVHDFSSPIGDGRTENALQIQYGDISSGACPSKGAFAITSDTIEKVPLPTCEFHVMSEEGINLFVDLSSRPDWSKELNNEVSMLRTALNYKAQSLQQELGCIKESSKQTIGSYLDSMDACQVKDGLLQTRSPPAAILEESKMVEIKALERGDELLKSSAIITCDADDYTLKQLQEGQAIVSSKPDSCGKNEVTYGTESFQNSKNVIPNGSNASAVSPIESVCNSAVDTARNIQQCPVPSQNSCQSNNVFEHSVLHNRSFAANPGAAVPGYSTSSSVELQPSEVANARQDVSHASCNNDKCLGIQDLKCNMQIKTVVLPESNEQSSEIDLLACAVESEKSNTINGKESSESSQQENLDQLIDLRSIDIESNGEPPKKRQHVDIEYQNGSGKPVPKFRKSLPQPPGEVTPRRSMRLVSK